MFIPRVPQIISTTVILVMLFRVLYYCKIISVLFYADLFILHASNENCYDSHEVSVYQVCLRLSKNMLHHQFIMFLRSPNWFQGLAFMTSVELFVVVCT